jgi:Ca2+-binding RTX toxin-like protein
VRTIRGAAERDALFGGRGADTLNGNEGDDWLAGGADNDTINGNEGNDKISGGGGDDTIDGGPGDDVIVSAAVFKQRRFKGGCDRRWRNFGGCDKGRNFNGGRKRFRGRRGGWRWVVAPQGKDTVTCGEGADKVFADKDDVVAADCENVVRLEDKLARRNKRR